MLILLVVKNDTSLNLASTNRKCMCCRVKLDGFQKKKINEDGRNLLICVCNGDILMSHHLQNGLSRIILKRSLSFYQSYSMGHHCLKECLESKSFRWLKSNSWVNEEQLYTESSRKQIIYTRRKQKKKNAWKMNFLTFFLSFS